jgi:hypothetical protein
MESLILFTKIPKLNKILPIPISIYMYLRILVVYGHGRRNLEFNFKGRKFKGERYILYLFGVRIMWANAWLPDDGTLSVDLEKLKR